MSEEVDNLATGAIDVTVAPGCGLTEVAGRTTGRRGPIVGTEPVPLRATVCGLPEALSIMLRVPVLVPVAAGMKVTAIAQPAPALTVVPQVFACAKSPLAVMPEIASEA